MNLDQQINKVLEELFLSCKDQNDQYSKMLAISPPDRENYNYGDLVPLSFVFRGLNMLPDKYKSVEVIDHLKNFRKIFFETQQDSLWAFNTGDLITCIDSSFIICATEEFDKVVLLDRFKTEDGWFLPQLCSLQPEKNKMTIDDRILHWCQKDYNTLCLVTALRRKAGLPVQGQKELIKVHFGSRCGLFIANPYFTDWLLTGAIMGDRDHPELSLQLASQLITSLSDRSKSMQFDTFISISLCLISLYQLGYWHKMADEAVNVFLETIEQSRYGTFSLPFYSSMKIQWSGNNFWNILNIKAGDHLQQVVQAGQQYYEITYYQDTNHLIALSIALMTLTCLRSGLSHLTYLEHKIHTKPVAPYHYRSHSEYIRNFCMPNYTFDPYFENKTRIWTL